MELGAGIAATFVGLDDLIEMKRRAGRAQDRDDVAALERLHERGSEP
jgi:predicted nucleotidyltransferase